MVAAEADWSRRCRNEISRGPTIVEWICFIRTIEISGDGNVLVIPIAFGQHLRFSARVLLSTDDPPLFMSYDMAPGDAVPADERAAVAWMVHHVAHGIELKQICDRLGVEAHLQYPGQAPRHASGVEFLEAKLLAAPTLARPGSAALKPR